MLLGVLLTRLVPPGATIVLGADETVERRSAWRARQRVRSRGGALHQNACHPVLWLEWVAMMRLSPVPWSPRVWALPFLTALCWPAAKAKRRRLQDQRRLGPADDETGALAARAPTGLGRRWRFAAVSLALACVTQPVVMVSRVRWDAARYHPPGFQPPGNVVANPPRGSASAACRAGRALGPPWEEVEVDGYGGQRKTPVDLLPHRLVVYPARAPWSDPLRSGGRSGGKCARKPSSVPTCRRPRCNPGVGRHALVSRGSVCGGPSPSGAGDAGHAMAAPPPSCWRCSRSSRSWPWR